MLLANKLNSASLKLIEFVRLSDLFDDLESDKTSVESVIPRAVSCSQKKTTRRPGSIGKLQNCMPKDS